MKARIYYLICFFSFIITLSLAIYSIFEFDIKDRKVWKVHKSIKINSDIILGNFFDDKNGFMGSKERLLYTIDGGNSWIESFSEDKPYPYGVDFLDSKTGFMFGAQAPTGGNGTKEKTVDGGKTWTHISDDPIGYFSHTSFVSTTIGWIANTYNIMKTKNGGVSWTEVPLPKDYGSIAAIMLKGEDEGFFLDSNLEMFGTKDSGLNWEKIALSTFLPNRYNVRDPDFHRCVFRFYDENRGDIILWQNDPVRKWINAKTIDGGRTWEVSELKGADEGFVFLSQDGKYLTIIELSSNLVVLRRREP